MPVVSAKLSQYMLYLDPNCLGMCKVLAPAASLMKSVVEMDSRQSRSHQHFSGPKDFK